MDLAAPVMKLPKNIDTNFKTWQAPQTRHAVPRHVAAGRHAQAPPPPVPPGPLPRPLPRHQGRLRPTPPRHGGTPHVS